MFQKIRTAAVCILLTLALAVSVLTLPVNAAFTPGTTEALKQLLQEQYTAYDGNQYSITLYLKGGENNGRKFSLSARENTIDSLLSASLLDGDLNVSLSLYPENDEYGLNIICDKLMTYSMISPSGFTNDSLLDLREELVMPEGGGVDPAVMEAAQKRATAAMHDILDCLNDLLKRKGRSLSDLGFTEYHAQEPPNLDTETGTQRSGSCGEALSWRFDEDTGLLSFSGSGSMADYEQGRAPWYWLRDRIIGVSLPDGLTSVGYAAFFEFSGLKTVRIPDGVTSIGAFAFRGCAGLTEIDLPAGVKILNWGTFSGCGQLAQIAIPDTVEHIQPEAFKDCVSLESVVIPDSVALINRRAFSDCTKLSAVTVLNPYCTIEQNFSSESTLGIAAVCEIRGYEASTAQTYAEAFGYRFVSLGKPPISFRDTPKDEYFYEPVMWAAENGITTGTSLHTFSPEEGCTRAQVVTFLWRAAGKPEVKEAKNPFADVAEGEYYYEPVLWAVQKGITTGTDETHFSPDDTCTRAQIVTFLWRYEGKPEAKAAENPFADVDEAEYYAEPVLWAVANKITTGTSETTFEPDATCTRAQVVTFLYRDSRLEPQQDGPAVG